MTAVMIGICSLWHVSAADSGFKVRVGMKYGSSSPVCYTVTSSSGFTIGVQQITGTGREFTPMTSYSWKTSITAVIDTSIKASGSSYVVSSASDSTVGGYHLQLTNVYSSADDMNRTYTYASNVLASKLGIYGYPAYVNGEYRVRIGHFKDAATAQSYISKIQAYLSGWNFTVVSSDSSGTTILSDDGTILFQYVGSDAVGVTPTSSDDYIKAADGYIYEGVFAFPRYTSGSVDGVQVINVLDLDRYTAGVIPYEVFASWNDNTLKAFAIVARSYAVANFSSGNSTRYNFDLTNRMQVYNGARDVTDKINSVVNDTSGLVISYNGKVATAYYSSSVGGTTAYSGDIWSSYLPYLVSVDTPWERYSEFSTGFWTTEVTPTQLATVLKNSGRSVSGTIKSVQVTSYGSGTPYVTGITFTDSSNNTITVTGGDKVRTTLGTSIVKSSNFVVGKGSVSYTKDTVTSSSAKDGRTNLTSFTVISSLGKFISSNRGSYTVITGSGNSTLTGNDAYVSTDPSKTYTASKNFYTVTTTTSTYTASSSSSFVFVGKGYGHGVGGSQYGMRDLGVLGYTYEEIIHAYYTDVEISNINNVSH
jgi:stage II sporulation protein D